MAVVGIHHVQLAMPEGRETEARAFYSGLLGIPEVSKPLRLALRGGAWFEDGIVKVHLGVESEFKPARKAHPGLLVHDLSTLVERLREAGHIVSMTIRSRATTACMSTIHLATGSSFWSRARNEPVGCGSPAHCPTAVSTGGQRRRPQLTAVT